MRTELRKTVCDLNLEEYRQPTTESETQDLPPYNILKNAAFFLLTVDQIT